MSDLRSDHECDLLAAEYALRLLEGEALLEARGLAGTDPAFAAAVAAWEARLAPLIDEIAEAEPSPGLRARILAALPHPSERGDNVVALRRKVGRWRLAAGAMTALAASLALILVSPRGKPSVAAPSPPALAAPMLVASLTSAEADTSVSVAFDRRDRSLAIVPSRISFAPGHDHQLWIIPAGHAPVSLGIVHLDAARRLRVSGELVPHFRVRATIAVSVEPAGGSPTGQPTGPVVASGALVTI